MKYMKRGLALLMALAIMLTIMPVKAGNISGAGENLAAGESLPEGTDNGSVSGDTLSSPNGGKQEQEKLPETKKDVAEIAVKEAESIQPYAAGDIASGTDGNISWVIDGSGKLTVTGSGELSGGNYYDRAPWHGFAEQITSAKMDVIGMLDASGLFYGCENLINLDLSGFRTTNVTDTRAMFDGCSSLVNLDLSGFDTTSVTNMWSMFNDCSSLVNIDLSGFDTTNVIDMSAMFSNCNSLVSVDLSGFDTANVTDMGAMFSGCRSLTSVDLSGFKTTNVTNMGWMFSDCGSLTSVDLSGFKTMAVTDMRAMFDRCSSLVNLDLSGFDTTNVTDMWSMFSDCSSLMSVDLSGFKTMNVADMQDMFSNCSSLVNLDLSGFKTMNVTDMCAMFSGCSSLKSINLSGFDTANVTDMGNMFSDCSSLVNLDLSRFDTMNVIDMWSMFSGCYNLLTIHTPRNLKERVELPVTDDTDIWRLPDGTDITELPQNRSDSVIITRYRNPKIITETQDLNMSDVIRVKYVPYSYTVETNNWDPDNIVTYSIEKGTLARGLQMYPATGEIYGMPLEAGTFPITVKATFSNPRYLPSYKDLTLTVLDNTDSNVWNASDPGYEVEQYVGTLVSGSGSCPVLTELTDQLFVSAGTYGEFIDFWLNGEKLTEGRDYTKEEGSTRITIKSQTFRDKADKSGVNTIAAEFRVGGDTSKALKRTAQNFRIQEQENNNSGNSGSGRNTRHNETYVPSPALQATAVVRLSTPSGAPLSGILVELHSTPMEAVTDANGAAIFNGVEGGWHTLYVKDTNGTILASKGFELLFGERESIEGDQITAKAGEPFTLAVQMEGDKLTFVSFVETVAVQENNTPQTMQMRSANTGDAARPGLWFTLFVSFGALMGIFLYGEQKKHMIQK